MTDQLTDRLPPQDLEAERCVLGSMLADPECIDDVTELVHAGHFYADPHRRMFNAIQALHHDGKGIDAVTLAEHLQATGELGEVGGPPGILSVLQAVPHAAHARFYADTVRDKAYRRDVIHRATEMIRSAYDPTKDQAEVLQAAEQQITQLSETRSSGGPVDLMTCLLEAVERIEAGKLLGLRTGFVDLDHQTTGMHDGQVIVVAARPGVGKTAFALSVAHAVSESVTVGFMSLEMGRIELADRLLSMESGMSLHAMRNGELSSNQRQQMMDAGDTLRLCKIEIDDRPAMSVMDIASAARRMRRRSNLGLLVIDYLQLIQPADKRVQREQQVAEITRALKCLAKSLSIPIVLLAQLNRDVEKRDNKRPRLSDLRESGAIEQDADQVWFLHRPEEYLDETDPAIDHWRGKCELILAKNRQGPTGIVTLTYHKETMRFRNYSGADVPAGMPSWPGDEF